MKRAFFLILLCLPATGARADGVALVPLEPLGIDAERALRLEALFRAELERLAGGDSPPRRTMEGQMRRARCSGELACLAAVGRAVGVRRVVAGNIGQLGASYVVNLKLIDVARVVEVRRVSERLRGQPDELIEAVRVAAHRLLRPEEVRGALAVLSDLPATVFLDGKEIGRTPLDGPLEGLDVGRHELRLEAPGFEPVEREVEIHFEKTSEVVVRLAGDRPLAPAKEPRRRGWAGSPWTWAAVGVAAVVLGVVVGRALASDGVVDCRAAPGKCP